MVADRQIAAQVKEELIRHGAYFMTETEQKQLTAFLGLEKGTGLPDKEFIGKTGSMAGSESRICSAGAYKGPCIRAVLYNGF